MVISKKKAILLLILVATVTGTICPTGSSVIPNCKACSTVNSNIVCSECMNGYYLTSSLCVACSSVVANCNACSLDLASQPTCFVCQSGFGLLGKKCQDCTAISGCATCTITNYNLLCASCSPGLVLYSAEMRCIACAITNCNNCSVNNNGNFTCLACSSGYFLSGGACSPCASNIPNCANCLFDQNGRLVCSSCVSSSMVLANNTCSANCSRGGFPNCRICQMVSISANTMICTACLNNYYLDTASNNCLSCAQALTGCTACSLNGSSTSGGEGSSGTVVCSACGTSYFLSPSNSPPCVLCSTVKPNCLTCDFDFTAQTGSCTSCTQGHYLNSTDSLCYSCSANTLNASFPQGSCAICSINGTTLSCSSCVAGYYLINGTCKTCSSSQSSCSACIYNISSFICSACVNGMVLNSVSQCMACSSLFANCSFCSKTECTDCLAGFYTLNNKNCLINCAVANCNQCVLKDNSRCSTCKVGYSLTNQATCAMVGCSPPLSFNGVGCICPFQNYYNQGTNSCLPCSDSGCETCPSNQCSSCLDGFFLIGTACSKCTENCLYCNVDGCTLCTDGFLLQGGKCVSWQQAVHGTVGVVLNANFYQLCGMGCSQCSSSACLACEKGFYLNGSSCTFCPSRCKACRLTTIHSSSQNTTNNTNTTSAVPSLACLACHSGHALIDNTCQACIDTNCVSCDFNPYFCLLCSITFSADANGVCVPCAANCNFCDVGGKGTCDEGSCFLGYTRFNTSTCVPCLNGCSSCNNTYPFACIGCLVGSYSYTPPNSTTLTCLNCDPGCDQCTGPNSCLSCYPGYSLANNACSPLCTLPCVGCSLSNKKTICTACLQGYSLADGTCVADFSCMSTNICEFCPLGYFAYRGSCHNCQSNCAQCSFAPQNPAFVISGNNYISFLNCTQCLTGYYLESTMTCLACSKNCSLCLSPTACTKCLSGYFLEYKLLNGVNSLNYSVGICLACSVACYECEDEPNRCLSCRPSFYLRNFVCLSILNVSFSYVLVSANNASDSSMLSSLGKNLPQLYNQIASSFGSIFSQNKHLVMIESITNGSVIVSGHANIDNNTYDPSSTYNSLSSNVQQTTAISGYKVGSYSISANGFTPSAPSTTPSSTDYLIYIIIGSAIVLVAALVIVICLCVRRARRNKEAKDSQAAVTEKGEQPNEPTTSKNMLKSSEVYPKSSVRVQDEFSQRPRTKKESRKQNKKPEEVSHISGSKTIVQPVQDRRSIQLIPTIYQQQRPSQEKSQSRSKSKSNPKSKPKTSNNLPQPDESQRYRSSNTIHIPSRDIKSASNIPEPYRELQQLRNDTNVGEEERTQKRASNREDSKRKPNSISKRYIPNSNSHFI